MNKSITTLKTALTAFVEAAATQGQDHIKPLHSHLVQRLVIEGGFRPEEITPRPPLRIESVGRGPNAQHNLIYDPTVATTGEQTILGGLKTKDVDVVVCKPNIGPCLAISVKGTVKAFRNLTNRMEEAAGDCTNLHISYPALVYGFLHVMRANRPENVSDANDIAIDNQNKIVDSIQRYHDAMARITNRSDLRNDVSRYEAVALALVHPHGTNVAEVVGDFPLQSSPITFEHFFKKLYDVYDLRFVYSAPALKSKTERLCWVHNSPVIQAAIEAGLNPRIQ